MEAARVMFGSGDAAALSPLTAAWLAVFLGALGCLGLARSPVWRDLVFSASLTLYLAFVVGEGWIGSAAPHEIALAGWAGAIAVLFRVQMASASAAGGRIHGDGALLAALAAFIALLTAKTVLVAVLWAEVLAAAFLALCLIGSPVRVRILSAYLKHSVFAFAFYGLGLAFSAGAGPAPAAPIAPAEAGAVLVALTALARLGGLYSLAGAAHRSSRARAPLLLLVAAVIAPGAIAIAIERLSILSSVGGALLAEGVLTLLVGAGVGGALLSLMARSFWGLLGGVFVSAVAGALTIGFGQATFDETAARLGLLLFAPAAAASALGLSALDHGAAGQGSGLARVVFVVGTLAGLLSLAGLPPFLGFFLRAGAAEIALSGGRSDMALGFLFVGWALTLAAARMVMRALRVAAPDGAGMPAAAMLAFAFVSALTIAALVAPDPLFALAAESRPGAAAIDLAPPATALGHQGSAP